MAHDPIGNRFAKRQKDRKLDDLSKKARGKDDVEAEDELVKGADKVEPLQAKAEPARNDPCPCGSGKKYKKCCGAE